MIYLITGYRRTGKDTLYTILTNHTSSHEWLVYSLNNSHLDKLMTAKQLSFAGELKKQVFEKHNVPLDICDHEKDIKQFYNSTLSARDLYIQHGELMKIDNLHYWCDVLNSHIDPSKDYIITDLRFINEANYFKNHDHLTIRIFRSSITIPDQNIDSEHNLDHYLTDYLLVSTHDEFNEALKIFPQYHNYTFSHKL
jgi:hypothetical protein